MLEDDDRVARILDQIGDEADRRWFLDRISEPCQRRARRLEERDARIREYAATYHPLLSGPAMASAIAVAIDRYRASGWRFERDLPVPADPPCGLMWRILHLADGRALSPGTVRKTLAGVTFVGQKKPGKLATVGRKPCRLALKSGTRRDVGSGAGSETADHREG